MEYREAVDYLFGLEPSRQKARTETVAGGVLPDGPRALPSGPVGGSR